MKNNYILNFGFLFKVYNVYEFINFFREVKVFFVGVYFVDWSRVLFFLYYLRVFLIFIFDFLKAKI